MPLTKASDALDLLIDWSKDIFTKNIIDEMEEHSKYLETNKLTEKALFEAEPEILKTIERLCSLETSFSMNSYFQSVPDTIRLSVMIRMRYFERVLTDYGGASVELPGTLSEFLMYGLIDLWNERQKMGPRLRQN